MTRAITPTDAIKTGTVKELPKDELCRLVSWGLYKNSNDKRCRPKRMPPDGDIVKVMEKMHTKCVQKSLGKKYRRIDTYRVCLLIEKN